MKILVTGGAGYIGSHAVAALAADGHGLAVLDNFVASSVNVVDVLKENFASDLLLYESDITDEKAVTNALTSFRPDAVIHCAGLKSVGESWQIPLEYYRVNFGGTLSLLTAMDKAECNRIIFSSSATVYGKPDYLPIDEKHPLKPINPYGRSKLMAEQAIDDWQQLNEARTGVSLRYYNPVGAHPSLLLGENPRNAPNNLFPIICEVLLEKRKELEIYGDDFATADGTGERDYIHIVDLINAHVKALQGEAATIGKFLPLNIGTGKAASVKEIADLFERLSNQKLVKRVVERRRGDPAKVLADNSKSLELLGNYIDNDLENAVQLSLKFSFLKANQE